MKDTHKQTHKHTRIIIPPVTCHNNTTKTTTQTQPPNMNIPHHYQYHYHQHTTTQVLLRCPEDEDTRWGMVCQSVLGGRRGEDEREREKVVDVWQRFFLQGFLSAAKDAVVRRFKQLQFSLPLHLPPQCYNHSSSSNINNNTTSTTPTTQQQQQQHISSSRLKCSLPRCQDTTTTTTQLGFDCGLPWEEKDVANFVWNSLSLSCASLSGLLSSPLLSSPLFSSPLVCSLFLTHMHSHHR